MKVRFAPAVAALLFSSAIVAPAQASVKVNIVQAGADVVATAAGTLDLTGLVAQGGFGLDVAVRGTPAYVGVGSNGATVNGYTGFAGPGGFGGSSLIGANSGAGDNFAFNAGSFGAPYVFVGSSFVSGSALSGSATFLNSTLASLGLTTGRYVYTSAADTITINVGGGGVPEPATWALMILGFGAVGGAMRRRPSVAAKVRFA